MFKVNIKSKYLSSCVIALWIAIAGKFCSTSSCARAIHLCTDFTKIMTYNIQCYMLNLNKCCRVHYSKLILQLLYIYIFIPGWIPERPTVQTAFCFSRCPSVWHSAVGDHEESVWNRHPRRPPLAENKAKHTNNCSNSCINYITTLF